MTHASSPSLKTQLISTRFIPRSRKPLEAVSSLEGSNPSPSAGWGDDYPKTSACRSSHVIVGARSTNSATTPSRSRSRLEEAALRPV